MSISYYLVGWDVVDELDVVWKSLNSECRLFVLGFGSSPFLILGFNILIRCFSFANFRFNLLVFMLNLWYFHKRFEFRCSTPIFELRFWTIWLSTLKEPSWVRIFIGRFEFRCACALKQRLQEALWVQWWATGFGRQFLHHSSKQSKNLGFSGCFLHLAM